MFKPRIIKLFIGVFCFLSNPLLCLAADSTSKDAILYYKYTTPDLQLVHVAEVDPARARIIAANALDLGKRRESVAEIAKFHHALLAINGGFFKIGGLRDGLPAGILKHGAEWHGIAYKTRGAIGWTGAHADQALIDRVQTQTIVRIGQRRWPVHLMNQPGHKYKAVLYSRAYGPQLDANHQGTHIVIKNQRVAAILKDAGVAIPSGGYVYSIGHEARLDVSQIQIGMPVRVDVQVMPQQNPKRKKNWQQFDYIVGGAPLMIYNGAPVQNYQVERLRSDFIQQPYGRTAIGLLQNGHWIFVVVENNPVMNRPGMTIASLTELMQKLNCRYALNLDGGGSSTMYLSDQVVNHTEGDEDEGLGMIAVRKVSDAILVLPPSKPI